MSHTKINTVVIAIVTFPPLTSTIGESTNADLKKNTQNPIHIESMALPL